MKKYNSKVKIIKILLIFLIFNFSFLIFHLNEANAQQISLSLSPPLIEAIMKPGKSIMIAFNLGNLGDPAVVRATVLPFSPMGNLGQLKVKQEFEGPVRFSLQNSIIKLNEPFFMKSKDETQILLLIRVPEGAPEGDYYYSLLIETDPPAGADGITGSLAKVTIGSNILVTVTESGNVEINGKIALFDVVPRFRIKLFGKILKIFDSGDTIPVVLTMTNNGKNLIKSHGEIILQGNFGEKASHQIIPQNILAESQRIMLATPSATFNCENNRTRQACLSPTSLLLSGFFIGGYKLFANVNFGEGMKNLTATASFIALPIKFMILFSAAIIIAIIIIIKLKEQD